MWGVWCIRSPSSRFGYAANWLKEDGVMFTGTEAEAVKEAARLNEKVSTLSVTYFAKEIAA